MKGYVSPLKTFGSPPPYLSQPYSNINMFQNCQNNKIVHLKWELPARLNPTPGFSEKDTNELIGLVTAWNKSGMVVPGFSQGNGRSSGFKLDDKLNTD
jgi:hypothetical protein